MALKAYTLEMISTLNDMTMDSRHLTSDSMNLEVALDGLGLRLDGLDYMCLGHSWPVDVS